MTPYSSGEWYKHCKENCLKYTGNRSVPFRDGWNIGRSVTELVGTNRSVPFRDGWNIARSVTELMGTNDLNKA